MEFFMGRRLKTARISRGLTGEQLAELCHINATYLRQIEAERKTPSLPVFISLCNELKVSPTYLLVDVLIENELSDFGVLSELWESATQAQIEIVTAMVRSELNHM